MPPPPPPPQRFKDDLIPRTISNIEQAKGIRRTSVPVARVLSQPSDQQAQLPPDLVSLPDSSDPGDSPQPPDMATHEPASDASSARVPDSQPPLSPHHHHQPPPPALPTPPTRADLTACLNASTELIQSLRTRNSLQAADLQRLNGSIETRRASVVAKLQVEGRRKARWMRTSCASLGLWVVYVGWCWVNSVEFEYVRRRRMDVLGML